ncbi:hypothetical protein M8C21_001159, partial [Ambrosia artemisiifolia]
VAAKSPDWSGLHSEKDCYLAYQRLAIVDPASGDQPLYNEDKTIIVTVNGEIYNHKALKEHLNSHTFNTGSDCEVIAHLYEEYGEDFVHMLDGMFSFVLLDTRDKSYIAARDAIGITTWVGDLMGSPDLVAAREVADYLGTRHHEFYFTVQEGIEALEEVIYHIETYDVTTIRASTPMFLMSRKIKSLGVKMVLSGEGSDEIFGGYLYFHKAPNKEEFHEETCRKVLFRANKSTSAWGLEARVPFLDKDFIDVAMSIDPKWKMIQRDIGRNEKWVLRNAFDDDEKPYLPKNAVRLTLPGGPSVACSTSKTVEWDASWSKNLDPSGRAALGVHTAAYENTK